MESYSQFISRINSFEVPSLGIDIEHFTPSNSVRQKVNEGNKFSPFFGDTVVFDLSYYDKARIQEIVRTLYVSASGCFCEKLQESTFHMTLHDLANGSNEYELLPAMIENLSTIKARANELPITSPKIKMKSNFIINMVNTSLVLALKPKDEEEYKKLFSLYDFFEDIYPLPYPFTPHITLAYYNRNGFSPKNGKILKALVEDYNKFSFDFELDISNLCYQRFSSMNSFFTLFKFA